jgi:hypothetical protein
MRRLLAICSAVGLLCGALGCHTCSGGGHVSGRCDCDDAPEYGCHFDMYGHGGSAVAPLSSVPVPQAEPLKALPKEIMPKDDAK